VENIAALFKNPCVNKALLSKRLFHRDVAAMDKEKLKRSCLIY